MWDQKKKKKQIILKNKSETGIPKNFFFFGTVNSITGIILISQKEKKKKNGFVRPGWSKLETRNDSARHDSNTLICNKKKGDLSALLPGLSLSLCLSQPHFQI